MKKAYIVTTPNVTDETAVVFESRADALDFISMQKWGRNVGGDGFIAVAPWVPKQAETQWHEAEGV